MVEKADYRKELMETANKIARPGFGILAADESTGTIGKRFESIGLENTSENARRYRELLFTTPDIEKYISGVILFDETTKQATKDGKNFVKLLQEKGIVPGIKVIHQGKCYELEFIFVRSTRVLLKFQALSKEKPPLSVLMTLLRELRHTTNKESDSPSGEPFLRSAVVLQLTSPSKKTHGDWQDTLLSAKTTVLSQSLSLKSLPMATTTSIPLLRSS